MPIMSKLAASRQLVLVISCALALGGCGLSSGGADVGDSDSASDFEVAASVASEEISARLVEEGVDTLVAAQLTDAAEAGALAASEDSSGSRVASGLRKANDESADTGSVEEMTIPVFLGEYSAAFAAALPAVESNLPDDVDSSLVLALAMEEMAGLETNAEITGLSGEEAFEAGAIISAAYGGMLMSVTVLAVIPTSQLGDFASLASESIMTGLANAGLTDPTKLQTALGAVTTAASTAFGATVTDVTLLADLSEKLGTGIALGIQKNSAFSASIDLNSAMESISTFAMAGLAAAGVSSSQIGTLAGSLMAGMTAGAIAGASSVSAAGGTPVFSVAQINTTLSDCGGILSAAIIGASAAAGVDLSGLSSIGSSVASSLGSAVSESGLSGAITVSGGCTVSLTGGSGLVSVGGTGGSGGTAGGGETSGGGTSLNHTFNITLSSALSGGSIKIMISGTTANVPSDPNRIQCATHSISNTSLTQTVTCSFSGASVSTPYYVAVDVRQPATSGPPPISQIYRATATAILSEGGSTAASTSAFGSP